MKEKTGSFKAKGDDGVIYSVDIWTTKVSHNGHKLDGSYEYLLSDGDELFDVPGTDNQWDIASTDVRITRME